MVIPRVEIGSVAFVFDRELVLAQSQNLLDPVLHTFVLVLLPEISAEHADAGQAVTVALARARVTKTAILRLHPFEVDHRSVERFIHSRNPEPGKMRGFQRLNLPAAD